MAEIEIGLGAVLQHVNFAMLIGAHRARVDVKIGIEFLEHDLQSPVLQECAQGSRRETFPQGTNHTTGDKNIFHFFFLFDFALGRFA